MTLRKATKEEWDKITLMQIKFLEADIITKTYDGFKKWKEWVNKTYDFGEKDPSYHRLMIEVLEFE